MRPISGAVAGGAVISEAIDVVDMCADAATAQFVEPAFVALEAEAVEDLCVPNVQPEAGYFRRVIGEEFLHFGDVGKFMEMIAVLETDRDSVGGRVFGDLGERSASQWKVREGPHLAALRGMNTQALHVFCVALTLIV
jgi:hypothetical protein